MTKMHMNDLDAARFAVPSGWLYEDVEGRVVFVPDPLAEHVIDHDALQVARIVRRHAAAPSVVHLRLEPRWSPAIGVALVKKWVELDGDIIVPGPVDPDEEVTR